MLHKYASEDLVLNTSELIGAKSVLVHLPPVIHCIEFSRVEFVEFNSLNVCYISTLVKTLHKIRAN